MTSSITKKRALLSVYDKTGIVDFSKSLVKHNWEIVSTGGTRKVLMDAGIPVIDITTISGNPEAFGGRMKTISFNVESAILFDRERDSEEAESLGIKPIDMVVCNLYPFGDVLERGGDHKTLIEHIDVGGPTMVRAAAKNYKYVTVVTDPSDYGELKNLLTKNNGETTLEFRREAMKKAFNLTADYDSMISKAMDGNIVRLAFDSKKPLRYGENDGQTADMYRQKGVDNSLYDMEVLHGKELSFNNILDIQAAVEAIKETPHDKYSCSVVKHTNCCGIAEGPDVGISQREILELAWAGDPISAFGSIIAFNQIVGLDTVEFFELENKQKRKFFEVIVAPEYDPSTLQYLKQSKNLRIVKYDVTKMKVKTDYRIFNGVLLKQTPDDQLFSRMDIVTEIKGDLGNEKELIKFGLRSVKTIKSNAIVIVREKDGCYQLLGAGIAQPNRVVATKLAIDKAKENLRDGEDLSYCWLISDAFMPFPDCAELASVSGIRRIVQPGGSIRDDIVISKCNDLKVLMVFTGLRHFRH